MSFGFCSSVSRFGCVRVHSMPRGKSLYCLRKCRAQQIHCAMDQRLKYCFSSLFLYLSWSAAAKSSTAFFVCVVCARYRHRVSASSCMLEMCWSVLYRLSRARVMWKAATATAILTFTMKVDAQTLHQLALLSEDECEGFFLEFLISYWEWRTIQYVKFVWYLHGGPWTEQQHR